MRSLSASLLATVLMALIFRGPSPLFAQSSTALPVVEVQTDVPQFFIDDYSIAEQVDLKRTLHQARLEPRLRTGRR